MSKNTTPAADYVLELHGLDSELQQLRVLTGGYVALEMLVSHCMQKLDGSDRDIPVAPMQLGSLMGAMNEAIDRQMAKAEHRMARAHQQAAH